MKCETHSIRRENLRKVKSRISGFPQQELDTNPPRIHDLCRLAEKCHISLDEQMLDKLEFVTRFNLNVRYPDYQQEFYKMCTKDFSSKALNTIDEVRKWLKSLIKKS